MGMKLVSYSKKKKEFDRRNFNFQEIFNVQLSFGKVTFNHAICRKNEISYDCRFHSVIQYMIQVSLILVF